MKVDYIELEQCNECPYRDTEIIEETIYAEDTSYFTATVLRCRKYFSCERIANLILFRNPPRLHF